MSENFENVANTLRKRGNIRENIEKSSETIKAELIDFDDLFDDTKNNLEDLNDSLESMNMLTTEEKEHEEFLKRFFNDEFEGGRKRRKRGFIEPEDPKPDNFLTEDAIKIINMSQDDILNREEVLVLGKRSKKVYLCLPSEGKGITWGKN